jgi:preprotein translocase subunit SecD
MKLMVTAGCEGSVAYIDILNDTDLALLKKKSDTDRILVNEASLTFYIDQDKVTGMGQMTNTRTTPEPKRVYLYDVKNKRPVYDYYTDVTEYAANKKFDKYVHGGILETSSDGQGYRYKIRITDHINNILNKDSTNVKLALVVTENINLISNAVLKTPFTTGAEGKQQNVTTMPAASVMHPFGTVLFGNTPDVPDEKRLKLEIYYTKPTTD